MNKGEERQYLDVFAQLRPDLSFESIRECERPDFICSVAGVTTGIEMTRFFYPSSSRVTPQAVNGYRDQLASNLRAEHSKRGLPPLHVSVHLFSEEKLLARQARQRLMTCLLDFVGQHIPPQGPHVEFDYDSMNAELIDLGVDRIAVLRSAALKKPFWALPYAAFIPDSNASLIQGIVTEKSACASEYRKKASSLWLLIVSGSGGLHSIVDFDGDVLTASYASSFDRIFLLRTFGSSVHELKLA